MPSSTDMNIILGQGTAIKEVHNVKKQNLEFNQQFTAQSTEDKKREDKLKVQEFEESDRIEIEKDKENKKRKKGNKKALKRKKQKEIINLSEGKIIDIRV